MRQAAQRRVRVVGERATARSAHQQQHPDRFLVRHKRDRCRAAERRGTVGCGLPSRIRRVTQHMAQIVG